MDIGAPFYKLGMFGDDASLVVAALLGVGFGFFLERAGFGSARKLTAQFYLTDMSVFKVMFTAIVTAMVGVFALSAIGWLDFSKIYLVPTYVLPQVVAGFVFGVGFIIGGYCPGTSVAGIATGRIDAGLYALGMLSGIFLYAESFNAFFASWAEATPMGQVTLPALFGIPPAYLVLAVVLMALAGFAGAERIEAAFRPKA
jgi:hypothetical protein